MLTGGSGGAPDPVLYIIFRSTRHADGTLVEGYCVPGENLPLDGGALDAWLAKQGRGAKRPTVVVLVIREVLDTRGMILTCRLELRLGSAQGPFHGDIVRVDLEGPARVVRVYRRNRDGRLTEVPPSAEHEAPRVHSGEPFTGEWNALLARFGPGIRWLDARGPTLSEDAIWLSRVMHIQMPDGREVPCGVGWHGNMAFVLEAEFPRFSANLELPPKDAAAIDAALRDNDLVRGETRLDQDGLALVARQRGQANLFLLRAASGKVRIEPHAPGRDAAGPDQQRWLRYEETYESLNVLDVWHDGMSENIIALTGDLSGQLWRHHVDFDGVETWRKTDEDAAFGALHREHLFPGTLQIADTAADAPEKVAASSEADDGAVVPAGSVLALAEAYGRAKSSLHTAREAIDDGQSISAAEGRELEAAFDQLEARVAAAMVRTVLARPNAAALVRLEEMLQSELALMRGVVVPAPYVRWLEQPELAFGMPPDISASLPPVDYHVAEAATCLALRRPTAAAFHCMKIMEVGIGSLAQLAGKRDPIAAGDREWQPVLRMLNGTADQPLRTALDALDGVRRCWRAPSLMPADKYTEEEGERLAQSVGTFMRALVELHKDRGERPGKTSAR